MTMAAITEALAEATRWTSTWFDRDRGALIATALLVRITADMIVRPDFVGPPRVAFLGFVAASLYVLLRPWGHFDDESAA